MSSRAILGLASIGGLLVSMALPAFAQTTPTNTTNPPPSTTTTTPQTTPTTKTPTTPNCPPAPSTSSGNTNSNGTSTSGYPNQPSTTTTTQPKTTTTPTCTNTGPAPAQPAPQTAPMTTPNYDALTNNPNGPDWLAKFNRPGVRSNNFLGTTTRPHSMHARGMMMHCRYVMERGVKTKICK